MGRKRGGRAEGEVGLFSSKQKNCSWASPHKKDRNLSEVLQTQNRPPAFAVPGLWTTNKEAPTSRSL